MRATLSVLQQSCLARANKISRGDLLYRPHRPAIGIHKLVTLYSTIQARENRGELWGQKRRIINRVIVIVEAKEKVRNTVRRRVKAVKRKLVTRTSCLS
jgi:hypothetical protein